MPARGTNDVRAAITHWFRSLDAIGNGTIHH